MNYSQHYSKEGKSAFSLKSEIRHGYSFSPLQFSRVFKVLIMAIKWGRHKRDGKEMKKSHYALLPDDMILYSKG